MGYISSNKKKTSGNSFNIPPTELPNILMGCLELCG